MITIDHGVGFLTLILIDCPAWMDTDLTLLVPTQKAGKVDLYELEHMDFGPGVECPHCQTLNFQAVVIIRKSETMALHPSGRITSTPQLCGWMLKTCEHILDRRWTYMVTSDHRGCHQEFRSDGKEFES